MFMGTDGFDDTRWEIPEDGIRIYGAGDVDKVWFVF
jgi:hypothetical protein